MKRFLSVCMCVFILTISVITYLPVYAADNDFTLSIPSTADYYNIPASEVSSAISNRGDIYGSDHVLMWRYTPTSTYNWTSADKALWDYTHFSDSQLSAVMQSSNAVSALAAFFSAASSNNNIFSSLLSGAGALVSGNSDLFTSLYDKFTGNKNYLDAIEYDLQTGDLTLLADQVSALRKELKKQYYDSIGLVFFDISNNHISLTSSLFDEQDDYTSAYGLLNSMDYQFSYSITDYGYNETLFNYYGFNRSSFSYSYIDTSNKSQLRFVDKDMNDISFFDFVTIVTTNNVLTHRVLSDWEIRAYSKTSDNLYRFQLSCARDGSYGWGTWCSYLYSTKYRNFSVFKSYEALYNYVHGSQNAYLSSKVEEAGEDIKLSISDMNDNIGSKIDDLIDSINNKKEGMSADELQDVIDKALDSISGKIDNIGDNTEETNNKLDSLLSLMSEQNNILLQILGVTEYIAYNNTKEDGSDYTTDDLKNTFNTMFDGVRNAILYGTNTVNNSGATASVAAYSSEDLATQDINNLDIHNGLFGKFPFSIPYQLYEWLQVLEAEPVAPVFNYNYGFMIFKKDDPDCNLTIDLSVYEPWANQAKSFERLFFTLLMAVFIYKKFKGNSIF